MKKRYVIDTNVLMHDPDCLGKFEDNEVYIPHPVVEEIDNLKNARGETGYQAREVSKRFKKLRETGKIEKGIPTERGGLIKFSVADYSDYYWMLPHGWDKSKMDNMILLSAISLMTPIEDDLEDESDDDSAGSSVPVILVSNDTNMLVKANILGLMAQEYRNDRVDEELYRGVATVHISDRGLEMLSKEKETGSNCLDEAEKSGIEVNEYLNVLSWQGSSMLCKYDGEKLRRLLFEHIKPCDLETRNKSQVYLKESLLTPCKDIPLTIGCGPAGTGKTLFAIGCGLHQTMEANNYKRVLVCRPNVMMDEEIGFLPGTEQEKINPLLRGLFDNLEVIFAKPEDSQEEVSSKIDFLFSHNIITAQSLAYLRGRSINDTYIIIDEAQNCTPNQIMSIITRAGENSKMVILGDPNQIDNPRLDRRNNGLVYAIEKMKGSKLCDVITFDETECTRSPLAKEASDRLKL